MTSPGVISKSGTPAFLTPHTILKHISKRNQTLPNLLDCYAVCPAYYVIFEQALNKQSSKEPLLEESANVHHGMFNESSREDNDNDDLL